MRLSIKDVANVEIEVLDACPKCGASASLWRKSNGEIYVKCNGCNNRVESGSIHPAEAINKWELYVFDEEEKQKKGK